MTTIRDALMAHIPHGPHFILDTKVHDGIADLTVQCGGLRWCRSIAIQGREPDAVAADAEGAVMDWVNQTVTAMVDVEGGLTSHKYRRAVRGFYIWLKGDPSARRWLSGARKDDAVKRLLKDYQPETEAA